jgi:hypothetical protein
MSRWLLVQDRTVKELIMKAIASALLALSVLTGVAATAARADQADRIGTQDWWQQQDRNRN